MTRRDFVKPAFSLRKKRSVKTHALSLLGTTRLLSRSEGALISEFRYNQKKDGKVFQFEEDLVRILINLNSDSGRT